MTKPRYRCSELDQVLSCPASHVLKPIFGESEGGTVAWDGNLIHWQTAWSLVKELGAAQPDGGIPPPHAPPSYQLPAYVSWIAPWLFWHVKEEVPKEWALEVEPPLEYEFDRWTLTGHLDAAATSPDGMESRDFDYKTGRIPVDPADCNEQVGGYVALRRQLYGIEKAKFTILQPWNDEDEGYQRVSVVEVDGADKLDALVETLDRRVCSAMDRADELATGKHCLYCCGYRCPAILQLHADMKLRLTPEMLAKVVKDMPEGDLVDLVAEASTLAKPIDDLREQLKTRLADGHTAQSGSGLTAKIVESPGGYAVRDAVGMLTWLEGQTTTEQRAPMLSYPSGKIRDGLAGALGIPKTSKSGISAKSVFEGAAASYLEPKVKKSLIIS